MPTELAPEGFVRFPIADFSPKESIPFNSATKIQRPEREPIEIPELLRPYYEGKMVLHMGCREGDFLLIFAKYAKQVFGHEHRAKYRPLERKSLKNLPNIYILPYIGTCGTANAEVVMDADNLPRDLKSVDMFYHWGLPHLDACSAEEILYFIHNMEKIGRKGLLCWYGGLAPSSEFQEFSVDESIRFRSIERNNSKEIDSLSKTNEHIILIKNFG